ncbi:MATE family efflux transporter [Candidatus Pandoraea novymonadis]|uniref:Multidrug-efflux transporter n=1 Tax=Candidatus Pandoraea novymonadis TaxID=1808959 RepID=A0ABX5FE02_9BURK|nr:MATE family efflux transporter [Candidatus Pandoraea novymonadis]PSB91956.1 Multidrug resistance protein NorM [Candidatus Pandoraea novymonadis]
MWLDIQRITRLAWPVLIGQLASIAFGVIDTVMIGRYSTFDLASIALGGAIYITVYAALIGILIALSPIAAQMFGAGEHTAIGEAVRQALWLSIALAIPGIAILLHPQFILQLSKTSPELEFRAVTYLQILALGLPAALLFRVYSSLSTAIARPHIVMAIQLTGLSLKVPLNLILIYGINIADWQVPMLGSNGCAIATTMINWVYCVLGIILMARHPFLRSFGIFHRFCWPNWQTIRTLLKLGIPIGLSYLIEVTAFSFMTIFIARFGAETLAGHQIAANLSALLYMLPMSLAIATTTLTAQAIGLHDFEAAARTGRHGITFATVLALGLGLFIWFARPLVIPLYTPNATIASIAAPLLALTALYHVFDALQVTTVFVLRAYKVAMVPTVIYALSLWGVGLGGGYILGFDIFGNTPDMLIGASGFWFANSISLAAAACGLLFFYLRWITHRIS